MHLSFTSLLTEAGTGMEDLDDDGKLELDRDQELPEFEGLMCSLDELALARTG